MKPSDQADGLRKLLEPRLPRMVSVVSCGPATGRTVLAVNLAAAIARHGRSVVLIDENSAIGNACDLIGLRPRCELAHALAGDRTLRDVLLTGPCGIMVMPAARGLRMIGRAEGVELIARARLDRLLALMDFVIVDAAPGGVGALALPVAAHGEAIVVTSTGAQTVTQAYARIKELGGRFPRVALRAAVCRARSVDEAKIVCANLADVAESHLGLRLGSPGIVCEDPRIARAGGVLVDAFPRSRAAAQFHTLAAAMQTGAAASHVAQRRGAVRAGTDKAAASLAA
jgi:flagellar biosynthesis protein FlhG